jgi:hypothetical protein
MNKKFLTLLSCTSLLLQASSRDADRGSCCPTNTFQNLVAANNITAGSETVRGSITAASFILSSGDTLFNGLRNWAVLTNQAAVPALTNVLWAATPPGNTSPGITFDPATGVITLPISPAGTGLFFVQYSVRYSATNSGIGSAQLQQGPPAGPFTNIEQPAIMSVGVITTGDTTDPVLTAYALIRASAGNNALQLLIDLSGTVTMLAAVNPSDANAEMSILQLN